MNYELNQILRLFDNRPPANAVKLRRISGKSGCLAAKSARRQIAQMQTQKIANAVTECYRVKKDVPCLVFDAPTCVHSQIRIFQVLWFLNDGTISLEPNQFFELSQHTRAKGHGMKLIKMRSSHLIYHDLYSSQTELVTPWNELPQEVVSGKSVNVFKNMLDKCWAARKHDN